MLAPAAPPRNLSTVAELQLFGQADPDLGQSLLVALDGHTARGKAGIGFDEGVLHSTGRDAERLLKLGIFGWDFDDGARPEQVPCLSHSLKIRCGAGIRSSIEETIP